MLGQLTKQLIGEQVKDAIDSLRPPDLASISESIMGGPKSGPPPQEENVAAASLTLSDEDFRRLDAVA